MMSDRSCSMQPFRIIGVILLAVNWYDLAKVDSALPWLLLLVIL